MKIGFYGGLANNMYVFAKAFSDAKQDVLFIKDVTDTYPLSQPIWEDVSFTFDITDLNKTYSYSDWISFEKQLQFTMPKWAVDVRKTTIQPLHSIHDLYINVKNPLLRYYIQNKYLNAERCKVIDVMRTCDILMVCGIEGSILAMLSGRSYMIWPHGGDIRLAAGFAKLPSLTWKQRFENYLYQRLIKYAFIKSNWIATHDPLGVGGWFGSVERKLGKKTLSYLPIPLSNDENYDQKERRMILSEKYGINLDGDDFVLFVPSRLDFYWKGQDKIINALQAHYRIKIIFSGWGKDYQLMRKMTVQRGLQEKVQFLPFTLSKPLLKEFFLCSDIVIDQFKLGTYGTAAVEAMSCGIPVIMYINDEFFKVKGWCPPPIINVSAEAELSEIFERLHRNEIDVKAIGLQCKKWVEGHHGPEKVLSLFHSIIK